MEKVKAEIQKNASEWMKSKGYDRRTWKEVSIIISDFVYEHQNKSLTDRIRALEEENSKLLERNKQLKVLLDSSGNA